MNMGKGCNNIADIKQLSVTKGLKYEESEGTGH